jgi:UDP-glucose 4-epimerase
MTTVAVTGAGGYIGGRLVTQLREDPQLDVVPIVRQRRPWLGKDQIIVDLVTDPDDALARAISGADAIVHLAGRSEVVAATAPALAVEETVTATRRVGAAARSAKVRRIVYVSTVHVYGAALAPSSRVTEDTPPSPLAPYAEARLLSEQALLDCRDDLDVVVLRLTNAVGAPAHPEIDRWTLVANDLCRQAVVDHQIVLRTSGIQHRDFVDLGDACRVIAKAAIPEGVVPPGTLNLGSGEPMTVRALADCVQRETERASGLRPPIEAPPPEGPSHAPPVVDVERIRALGLAPTTPIEESVRRIVEFCRTHYRFLSGRRPEER